MAGEFGVLALQGDFAARRRLRDAGTARACGA
jgi:hypothetical protein